MSGMIDTTEMYLRTIFELEEEGTVPLRARIAERLGHSGPTVSQTVARMERDGLLTLSGDRHLQLTPAGHTLATRVMRKHRLAERLLVEVLGLEWEFAHEEACRWEHVMSERVERRILTLIGDDRESPYGNPIPGLGELGVAPRSVDFLDGVVSLTELRPPGERVVLVRRIGEPAQADHTALSLLTSAGLLPGRQARIVLTDKLISAQRVDDTVGEPIGIPGELASHVFVADQP